MYMHTCNVQLHVHPCADLSPLLLVAHGPAGVDGGTKRRCGHCLQLCLVTMLGTTWRGQPANTGRE